MSVKVTRCYKVVRLQHLRKNVKGFSPIIVCMSLQLSSLQCSQSVLLSLFGVDSTLDMVAVWVSWHVFKITNTSHSMGGDMERLTPACNQACNTVQHTKARSATAITSVFHPPPHTRPLSRSTHQHHHDTRSLRASGNRNPRPATAIHALRFGTHSAPVRTRQVRSRRASSPSTSTEKAIHATICRCT